MTRTSVVKAFMRVDALWERHKWSTLAFLIGISVLNKTAYYAVVGAAVIIAMTMIVLLSVSRTIESHKDH